MNLLFKSLSATIAFSIALSLSAEVKITYKWIDEKGEIHYTERAPKDIKYTKIRTYLNPNQKSTVVPSFSQNQNKIEEKKSSYGTWRDENCTLANQNLDILTDAPRIGVDDGKGGKRLMTVKEKKTKIEQMEKQRDKYCQSDKTK